MVNIQEAIELRKSGKFDEAIVAFKELFKTDPRNPEIPYQIGWTFDASDNSKSAIPFYKKALSLNLKNDRCGCFVALGSSLRATGDYSDAENVLRKGLSEFPEDRSLKVFLSMTLYNLAEPKEGVASLLRLLVESTSCKDILSYSPAIQEYAADLDQTW